MDPLAPTLDSGSLCRNHCNMTHLVASASANHDGHHRVLVVRERVAVTLGEREVREKGGTAALPTIIGRREVTRGSPAPSNMPCEVETNQGSGASAEVRTGRGSSLRLEKLSRVP